MLDLAKMEAGTFKFTEEIFDLLEVVLSSLRQIAFLADFKKISLKVMLIN
jgi:signal transduction histidine kinase